VPNITAPIRLPIQNRNMAARILPFPKPIAFPAPVQSFRVDLKASTLNDEPSKGVTEMEPESIGAGLGCIRGTVRILLLEGATAAVIYGVWHLAHVLR
jgi:hypothetical protein